MELPTGKTSRRALLGLAGVGIGGLLLGRAGVGHAATDVIEEPPVPHHDVTKVRPGEHVPPTGLAPGACGTSVFPHPEIGAHPTHYEVGGNPSTFSYDTTFYKRLETWLTFFYANSPESWTRPGQIWTYGAYLNRNDGCKSYHNFGRGFDLSRIYSTDPDTGALTKVFNARYDQWKSLTGTALTTTRKRYWATAASVHYHFKHVLAYPFNGDHHNHIHCDNASSGSGDSNFTTGSTAQVQHVQACVTYIWDRPVAIDGVWGPNTSAAVSAVLTRIGRTGGLATQANWLEFNRATMRFGSGAQTF